MIWREMLAFIQLTWLPGLLITGLLRPGFGRSRTFLILPGISLLLNYIWAAAALSLNCFTPLANWIYAGICLAGTLWLYRREISGILNVKPGNEIIRYSENAASAIRKLYRDSASPSAKLLTIAAAAGAAAGMIWSAVWFWNNIDTVFTCWDSALSWNFWAESWAKGIFPGRVAEYPQLLPMNWAVAYQLIGENVQFVPKASISLFPLLILLFFWDLGIRQGRKELLLTIPILSFYLHNVDYSSHGGELDILMAYYPTAAFFIFNYANEAVDKNRFYRQLSCAAMMVCAASVTKQAGLYLLAAMPFLATAAVAPARKRLQISRREWIKNILAALLLCLVIIVPYYLVAIIRTRSGKNNSNIQLVTHSIYAGKTLFERFLCSIRLFMLKLQSGLPGIASARWAVLDKSNGLLFGVIKLYYLHIFWGIMIACFNIAVLRKCFKLRKYRTLLAVTLLFFLIWSIFFCYDLRNLSLVLPFIALLLAAALTEISVPLRIKLTDLKLWQIAAAGVAVFCMLYPAMLIPRIRLHKFHEKQLDAGIPELNRQLQDIIADASVSGRLLTDYEYMKLFPDLQKYREHIDLSTGSEVIFRAYQQLIKQPDIDGILLPDYASAEIIRDVKQQEKSGKLRKYFSIREYTLYLKVRH